MRTVISLVVAAFSICAAAETNVIFTTRHIDGRANTWTLADLQSALELINRKYHREVATDSGRKAWHGKKIKAVTDAQKLTITTTYEDGTAFTDFSPVRTPAQSVAAHNQKLKVSVSTNGIPAKLAAARKRREAEINNGPTNVTVTIEAGR